MDIKEIRRANLDFLLTKHTAAEIARTADISPGFLYQILTDVKTRKGTVRGIGDSTARKIEIGFKKSRGWMDERHPENNQAVSVRDAAATYTVPGEPSQLLAGIYSNIQKLDENGLKELDMYVNYLVSRQQPVKEKKRAVKARVKS